MLCLILYVFLRYDIWYGVNLAYYNFFKKYIYNKIKHIEMPDEGYISPIIIFLVSNEEKNDLKQRMITFVLDLTIIHPKYGMERKTVIQKLFSLDFCPVTLIFKKILVSNTKPHQMPNQYQLLIIKKNYLIIHEIQYSLFYHQLNFYLLLICQMS